MRFAESSSKRVTIGFRLLFFISGLLILAGCVGKKRYMQTLQEREEARSEAAFAKTGYQDAVERWQVLEKQIQELDAQIAELRMSGQEQKSGDLAEQQRLINDLRLTQWMLDSITVEANQLRLQRSGALTHFDRLDKRLADLITRITPVVSELPRDQFALIRATDHLTLSFPAAFLFGDQRYQITPQGELWLTEMASALGGQPDLLIEIQAEPYRADGTPAAREEAAKRASIVASSLVERHGLSPELVLATARQMWPQIADGRIPAESIPSNSLSFRISIAGDWIQRVRQSLK